jgi:hypothetical protein
MQQMQEMEQKEEQQQQVSRGPGTRAGMLEAACSDQAAGNVPPCRAGDYQTSALLPECIAALDLHN